MSAIGSGPLAYLNGHFLPVADVHLPLHDAGFVQGATVTDLCRTFRHRLFRLTDHLTRFRRSCDAARIPQPVADDELASLAEQLAAHNAAVLPPEGDLALVIFATPGPIGPLARASGLCAGPGEAPPTLGLYTFPLLFDHYARLFREGAHLVVPAVRHVPAICVDPRIKQRSRLHWWLAEQQAHDTDPAASALLLDTNGHVTETAAANFLIVRQGTVLSPPRDTILGGISLQVIEEHCRELGIPFMERLLRLDDCLTADEAMLSSTPYCVAGVRRINDVTFPWPGPVWQRLLAAWSERVGIDVRRQILPP
jgi:branched-subunit amino acid aminotransferase/4-amino-4-deoxychorismate lyase